jgi:hypothetical protein
VAVSSANDKLSLASPCLDGSNRLDHASSGRLTQCLSFSLRYGLHRRSVGQADLATAAFRALQPRHQVVMDRRHVGAELSGKCLEVELLIPAEAPRLMPDRRRCYHHLL